MPFLATSRKKQRSHGCEGPALGDSLDLSQCISPSSRWPPSLRERWEGPFKLRESGGCAAFRLGPIHLQRVDGSASEGQGHLFWVCVQGKLLEVKCRKERAKCNYGQFRKSVEFLKCAAELPTIPVSDQVPTRILHDDLWCRTLRGVEFVSVEVITGTVQEAGSRMKSEASRDRARVNAKVRKWSLARLGSKKAAHAYLKGSKTVNTPALLGEDRRDGETLFDPNASVQLWADEWEQDLATR